MEAGKEKPREKPPRRSPPRRRGDGAGPRAAPIAARRAAATRRGADRLRARTPAGDGFRGDERRRDREREAEIRRLVLPLDLRRTRRHRPDLRGPAHRPAPHAPRQPAPGRRDPESRPHAPDHPPAAAGRALRHLRLDGALCADPAAFPARGDERPRPRARLPVRHAAVQRHPPAAPPRPRGRVPDGRPRRARLVRRHAHRRGAGRSSTASGRAACSARAPSCC